jgi:anamorsin
MSPTAVYTPLEQPAFQTTTSKGVSLVIGSPATAQDGKYQTLVTSLGESRTVEKQMLDRLVDGGTSSVCASVTLFDLISRS